MPLQRRDLGSVDHDDAGGGRPNAAVVRESLPVSERDVAKHATGKYGTPPGRHPLIQ